MAGNALSAGRTRAKTAKTDLRFFAAAEALKVIDNARVFSRLNGAAVNIDLVNERGAAQASDADAILHLTGNPLAGALRAALKLPLGPELRWRSISRDKDGGVPAGDMSDGAVKARPVAVKPKMRADRVFQCIAWNCLEQLLANYPRVIAERDTEALHQSRVALRRLRAAISIYKKMLVNDRHTARLKRSLRATAAILGEARDLDVLIDRVKQSEPIEGHRNLLASLRRKRRRAYDAACRMLNRSSFQRLLLRTALWIEDGDWQRALAITAQTSGRPPKARRQASDILRHLLKPIDRAPGDLANLGVRERHQLRIRAKKLRYANEFFAALWPGKKRARRQKILAQALERLQDSLGELNDIATHDKMRRSDGAGRGAGHTSASASVLDRLLRNGRASQASLLETAGAARTDALAVKRFWKKKASRGKRRQRKIGRRKLSQRRLNGKPASARALARRTHAQSSRATPQ